MIEKLTLMLLLALYLVLAVATVDALSTLRQDIDKNLINQGGIYDTNNWPNHNLFRIDNSGIKLYQINIRLEVTFLLLNQIYETWCFIYAITEWIYRMWERRRGEDEDWHEDWWKYSEYQSKKLKKY